MEKYFHFDRQKSVLELCKEAVESEQSSFNLVEKCTKAMKKPIQNLEIEELRLLIGQKIGLQYLIPIAIEELEDDILANGDLYPGDLLEKVIEIDTSYWEEYENQKRDLKNIIEEQIKSLEKALEVLK